jgi:hypothetical protein
MAVNEHLRDPPENISKNLEKWIEVQKRSFVQDSKVGRVQPGIEMQPEAPTS